MKIKCIKILSPATGKDMGEKSSWLTVGKYYSVLAQTLKLGRPIRFTIECDDNTPSDFNSNQFEVIDSSIPEVWVKKDAENGIEWYAPAAWFEDGFWDRLDEGDAQATLEYERWKPT